MLHTLVTSAHVMANTKALSYNNTKEKAISFPSRQPCHFVLLLSGRQRCFVGLCGLEQNQQDRWLGIGIMTTPFNSKKNF